MFIASCSFLRWRRQRLCSAWRGVPWSEERQLFARLGFLVRLLAGRRARWSVVAVARLERYRGRPAETLQRRDDAEDFLIGEANRRLVDHRHSRVEAGDDEGVGCIQRLREVLDIVQAGHARRRAGRNAIEIWKPQRP